MRIILLVLIIAITGCAQIEQRKYDAEIQRQRDEINTYSTLNKKKANNNEIKWSEFYLGLYDLYSKSSFTDKGLMMTALADFIDKSQQFETNKISKEEFELFRLKKGAEVQKSVDDLNAENSNRAALVNAVRPPPIYIPPVRVQRPEIKGPTTTNCYKYGNNVNCTTY